MIDLKDLRDNPERYRTGCARKRYSIDIDRLLQLDELRRGLLHQREQARAEQARVEKEIGPAIGKLMGRLKKAKGDERAAVEAEAEQLKAKPAALKATIHEVDQKVARIEPEFRALLLSVPQPPDPDVPDGESADDNVEIHRWNPTKADGSAIDFDVAKTFEQNKGFPPKSHIELMQELGMVDFERGVKIAGSRSYILKGDGMVLHNAILRYAFDFMTQKHGFTPASVPVLVREEAMVGTGFFPGGRDQAYHIPEGSRQAQEREDEEANDSQGPREIDTSNDLYLTGTGEVGLMALHQNEILDEADLPLKYTTVSTCFRREAGAAGKDTAGLYRIHQFDKVEQVVICRADEQESRAWHRKMIGYVEELLRSLCLPYRLLQCCAADLGAKNADMVDLECWMPSRGDINDNGIPCGAYGETHSASRLYDYQCRRLNMRSRAGGEKGKGSTVFCHSLNNTVAASPRILIPILEIWQNQDGTITVPPALRAYVGKDRLGPLA